MVVDLGLVVLLELVSPLTDGSRPVCPAGLARPEEVLQLPLMRYFLSI